MINRLDWAIIFGYILFSIGIGIYLSRRGTRSTKDYFTSGGGMPWWILGTSMVATSFAADTPLAISSMVITKGIYAQWFWWCQVPQVMLGVFFFARLWQRVGILTDNEFVSVRYSGKQASSLRLFKGIYFSLVYQCIVIGWVNLAMVKIIGETVTLGYWPVVDESLQWVLAHTMGLGKDSAWMMNELPGLVGKMKILLICFLITISYTAISGLWGVLITDFFQFILAMGGTILLAIMAVYQAGGMDTILTRLGELYGAGRAQQMIQIVPTGVSEGAGWARTLDRFLFLPAIPMSFLIYVGMLWWCVGYTDGGSYLAQRMLAAKDERNSVLGYLWYGICHFCIRPWPWLVVGLIAAVQYPELAQPGNDPELGYIKVMLNTLPSGLLGILLAAFLAAYMSTISTQINLGASYLVHDVYRPFINQNAEEKHYVRMSILATIVMAAVGILVTLFMNSIEQAWYLLSSINAGIGVVYLCRWYWWRVNAWSEISCLISCVAVTLILKLLGTHGYIEAWTNGYWTEVPFPQNLVIQVPITFIIWVTVTFLTAPVEDDRLKAFYRRVRPGGPGWKSIAATMPELKGKEEFTKKNLMMFTVGVVALYSALGGIGELILGQWTWAIALLTVTIVSGTLLYKSLSVEKWSA